MPPRIAVVIPAYNESKHIARVVIGIPDEVKHVIVVDDASTDNTAERVRQIKESRVSLIQHLDNQGVGGAVISGYRRALELGAEIVVKLDGDGQMDSSKIPSLIDPIIQGQSDYCKGARFFEWTALRQMPMVRMIGNIGLSFLTKLASGYWNILDPTNGFTAIHRDVLERLPLDKIGRGFFFETDMLIHLYYLHAVVTDVHIPARYSDEESKLNPLRALFSFPGKLMGAFSKRILWRYFIHDFTMCSLFMVAGTILFFSGLFFGSATWLINGMRGEITTTGTVMLAVVPLFLGFQLILQAIVLDITGVPREPMHSSTTVSQNQQTPSSAGRSEE